jgi:hypothetical protein
VKKSAIAIGTLVVPLLAAVAAIYVHRYKATSPQAFEDALHALQEKYYAGTTAQARQALLDEINLISSANYDPSRRDAQAGVLYTTYSRLCRLDKLAGDEKAMQQDYDNTRIWFRRALELSMRSPTQIEIDMNALSQEVCIEHAIRLDQVRPNFDKSTSGPASAK